MYYFIFILFQKITSESLGLLTRLFLSEEIRVEGKRGQESWDEAMDEAGKKNMCP